MTGIVERLRQEGDPEDWWERMQVAADEIERLQGIFTFAEAAGKAERDGLVAEIMRLRADKAAISQTASGYLHEIERLRKVCRDQAGVELSEENDRLIDEIERLRAMSVIP